MWSVAMAATSSSASPPVIVDIHTHIYPPSYISLLSSRTTVPYIYTPPAGSSNASPRLIILPSDDDASKPREQRGRPIDSSYSSFTEKRAFMTLHGIDVSVVSLANPWLDFLDPDTAPAIAQTINDDLEQSCAAFNRSPSTSARPQKLYGFATLPLSAPVAAITAEIERLASLPHIRGVIMGTTGLGAGLDDAGLHPVFAALAATQTLVFLHPHYGLPAAALGGEGTIAASGHVLPLALGFPLETTIAVARMFVAGIFDAFPALQMLLAHSGGALPFLAGRLQSCVAHEREFVANGGSRQGPRRDIWHVLRENLYLDAVVYGEPGLKAAVDATGGGGGGGGVDEVASRVMFGTDHPFFPPVGGLDVAGNEGEGEVKWESVETNLTAIRGAYGDGAAAKGILGGNAIRVLNLEF